jgi:hypothetical protein
MKKLGYFGENDDELVRFFRVGLLFPIYETESRLEGGWIGGN